MPLEVRKFFDAHCHFRLGEIMNTVVPMTANYCSYGTAMPNTDPRAILTAEDVLWYREQLMNVLASLKSCVNFEPLMTIGIRDSTTVEIVRNARAVNTVAGKVYPLGVTTNSENGLRDFFSSHISDVFAYMEEKGMLLLIHGEIDKDRLLVTKRESAFLELLPRLVTRFPKLKIVVEHVSTAEGVRVVKSLGNMVAATITAHHLYLTLNDVIGQGLRPHNACMPMPKDFSDRDALLEAVISGNKKFFLGSDSAPHPQSKKECAVGACGVFTAPHLPGLLATVFEQHGALDKLEGFTSTFGTEFYGLPFQEETICLEKKDWRVPESYGSIIPFKAGELIPWQLVN